MIILITGANRGLGLSLSTVCLEQGHRVIAGVRRIDKAEPLRQLKNTYRDKMELLPLDVSDHDSIQKASQAVAAITPVVDVIVNNAAREGTRCKNIEDVEMADLEETWKTNVLGPMVITKYFIPLMESSRHKTILNISSDAGSVSEIPLKYYGYCISKAALNMFTRLLDRDLRARNFKTLAVHPGWMKTEMGGEDATYEPMEIARHLYDRIVEMPQKEHCDYIVDYLGHPIPW
ncbi:SDR family oxidoreductase [Paenibacillus sp. MZ04-78.2]|uniref:SDR family oxidoreductase n=1 Tax=Paenibacillus sp. MZ04-78.2 TaxID=2962034 RepID=UPI0020B68D97|nr:SDR family oxidoreductase [Paenibacillus sp. MZ04-78.2]MCP3774500.1 SDR family oxidoreductase [Paenibacillus sp. MZ04-78.2]